METLELAKNSDEVKDILNEVNQFLEDSLKLSSFNKWEMANLSSDEVRTIYRIHGYCSMLSQTIIALAASEALWESEILMRSVSEGTIKLLYICCDLSTISNKLAEYRKELPDYSINKDSARAENFAKKVEGLDSVQKSIYLSLNDFVVPYKKPRKERKEIERKWSYFEMLSQIEKTTSQGFDKITALAYKYGLSSHLVHADYDAIGIVWERESREQKEQELLYKAHLSALFVDMVTMALLRAQTLSEAGEGSTEEYNLLHLAFNRIKKKLDALGKPWMDYFKDNDLRADVSFTPPHPPSPPTETSQHTAPHR